MANFSKKFWEEKAELSVLNWPDWVILDETRKNFSRIAKFLTIEIVVPPTDLQRVSFLSTQNQVPQIIIREDGVVYFIKTFSIVIWTTVNYNRTFLEGREKPACNFAFWSIYQQEYLSQVKIGFILAMKILVSPQKTSYCSNSCNES